MTAGCSPFCFIIYQLFPRLFGNKISTNKYNGTIEENGCGKFNDITDSALQELKKLGISHIWYTGVIEHPTQTDYSNFGIARDHADVVKGRAGSPFAIKDYYDVDPDLAADIKNRMHEFEMLIERTHDNGLKTIIDFIPNHVARVYYSDSKPQGVKDFGEDDDTSKAFDPGNNFYYIPGKRFVIPARFNPQQNEIDEQEELIEYPAKVTGNDVFSDAPSASDWYDAVKLNYGVDIQNNNTLHFIPMPDTWIKMKDILLFWASKKIDGFRCDMAEMIPIEFWSYAIGEVRKKYPQVIFIAEIYNPASYVSFIENAGFDFLYDKVGFYETVKKLTTGTGNTNDLTSSLKNESQNISGHMLRFMENHDEQRIASKQFAGNGMDAIPGMTATATMHCGPVMIFFGQETGENAEGSEGFSGDDGRTTIFDYRGVPAHQAWMSNGKFNGENLSREQKQLRNFYSKLLNLCCNSEAIRGGKFYELQQAQEANPGYNNALMYAYIRHTENEKLLVACNFQRSNFNGKIIIPLNVQSELNLHNAEVADLLTGTKFFYDKENGLDVSVQQMNAVIIKMY